VEPVIAQFSAPAHRCEKVAVVSDVIYLNDSKSTNLHSLESALNGQEAPVILIAGGKEKGLDFASLAGTAARSVKYAILFGENANRVSDAWSGSLPCAVVDDLEAAVAIAANEATEGDVVLFSPGTSSFDQYTGYEARGDAFRRHVLSLT
ncbi:MAG: cyanophycin synthetase, partial [Verrucomicrobiota bacterium]